MRSQPSSAPPLSRRLPVGEARKLRSERPSKSLTQAESEAAICDGIIRFQDECLGWRSERIQAHLLKDRLIVRVLRGFREPARFIEWAHPLTSA